MLPRTSRFHRLAAWPLVLAALLLALVVSGSGTSEASHVNEGFETGDLTGWALGSTTSEGVAVVGTDTINADEGLYQSPLEGSFMARLGESAPVRGQSQPIGPNEIFQTFSVDEEFVTFAYNIWTYDYTGFDRFTIELKDVNADNVIYTYSQQAWGASGDTARKNTGWQIVNIDARGYQGRLVRLTIGAGGSNDQLFPFWAYIDSAETAAPPQVVDFPGIKVNGWSPSRDPATQTIHVTRPPGGGPTHLDIPVLCPDGSTPTAVSVIVGTTPSPTVIALTKGAGNIWSGDIPTPAGTRGQSFPMTLQVICNGATITIYIGSITLIDPSGYVTDAVTTAPVVEATVTLQRKDSGVWVTVNPYETVSGNPTIAPQVNPQLTDHAGHYGWDVIAGTYRVIVEKTGYITQTSYEVTIPPPVTDLDIELVPGAVTPRRGDVDCDSDIDAVDALKVLRHVAALTVTQNEPCPDIGQTISGVAGLVTNLQGDPDCDGDIDSVDALRILRHVAGLPNNLPPGCPAIGSSQTPSPTATPGPTATPTATPTPTAAPADEIGYCWMAPVVYETLAQGALATLYGDVTCVVPGDADYTCVFVDDILSESADCNTIHESLDNFDCARVSAFTFSDCSGEFSGVLYTCSDLAVSVDCVTDDPSLPDYSCEVSPVDVMAWYDAFVWCTTLHPDFPDFQCTQYADLYVCELAGPF